MFPCNCHPPFPRPEPFSPLPRPGTVPDWGKWIRDRLAEKGALLAFPTRTAFPSAGSAPNLYLAEDTGVVYRWGGEGYAVLVDPSPDVETYPGRSAFPDTGRVGVIYIDASANLLYRWNGTGYVLLTSDLSGVESRLADVESKVPAQATARNQLADKAFVNSSIATNTATFRGTYNLVVDLSLTASATHEQVAAAIAAKLAALSITPDNNDYCFVQVPRNDAEPTIIDRVDRYKCSVEDGVASWDYEWSLNNSSFTADQWAAINSGITSGLVAKLGALPTAEALAAALAGKQDALTFDNAPTAGSNNPVKSGGIWSAIWGALSALPTGFLSLYDWCVVQLAGKASKFDATLTPVYGGNGEKYSAWTISPSTYDGKTIEIVYHADGFWVPRYTGSDTPQGEAIDDLTGDMTSLTWDGDPYQWVGVEGEGTTPLTATRVANPIIGYQLGSQTDKPLASEAEAEALRTGKANKADVDPLLFAQYYPDGSVKSAAEFTSGIKYDDPDTTNRTITVKPFCNLDGTATNDNSNLSGRVVIPPFVDAQGNGYISDDGTRYKVVGVSDGLPDIFNANLTAVIVPNTVTTIRYDAFGGCTALTSASLPAVMSIEQFAFYACTALTSVDFGDTPRSSVPALGVEAFTSVPETCTIIVPDAQYDEWIAAPGWSDLVTAGYKFLRHSEWEYARKYELDGKLDKSGGEMTPTLAVPTILSGKVVFGADAGGPYIGMAHEQNTIMLRPNGVEVNDRNTALAALNPTPGNIAVLDANGNPTDSQIPAANVALKDNIPYTLGTPIVIDTASSEVVEGVTVYFGAATLADRTANIVQVTAATALDELRITLPAATSGKVRDFGLRVEIGTGSAALAAPALVPVAPTGETIKIENANGAIPELADGTATAKGVTLLYFSETAPGVFVVKGEQVEEVL